MFSILILILSLQETVTTVPFKSKEMETREI